MNSSAAALVTVLGLSGRLGCKGIRLTSPNMSEVLTRERSCSTKFRVTIERDEEGDFVVQCPSLPGCVSEGKNREEALTNIRDAVQGYLTSLKKHDEPIPPPIEEETVEVSA